MGIIDKAAQLKEIQNEFVFGKKSQGKSVYAIRQVPEGANVLYVAFAAPSLDVPDEWDARYPLTPMDFDKVLGEIREGKWDTVILDDFHVAQDFYLPVDKAPSQQQWGAMAIVWSSKIKEIAAYVRKLIVTANVSPNAETGILEIDLTPSCLKRIISYFTHLRFCFVKNVDKKVGYFVQKDNVSAFNFNPTNADLQETK
jgi:hypothetical protein